MHFVVVTENAHRRRIDLEGLRAQCSCGATVQGKTLIIDGTVDYVTKDGDACRAAYKIPHPHARILMKESPPSDTAPFKTDLMCMMAYTPQLKPGKSIKLTGTSDEFSETWRVVWMKDYRPAK